MEFQAWTELLQKIHNRSDYPEFNPDLARQVVLECSDFILPGIVQGAGQYPQSVAALVSGESVYPFIELQRLTELPEILGSYEKAYTVLLLSLALHTRAAFLQAGLIAGNPQSQNGQPIYIEGKFRETRGYTVLLASLFPGNRVYTTEVQEATSYGAALLGWASVLNRDVDDLKDMVNFEKNEVMAEIIPGLKNYREAFHRYISGS